MSEDRFVVEYAVIETGDGTRCRTVQDCTKAMSLQEAWEWQQARYGDNRWGNESAWPEFVIRSEWDIKQPSHPEGKSES